jgi:molecular chaperone DnaK
LVYQTEKFLSENEDKIPDDVKTEVKDGVAELKKALEGTDDDAIKAASEKLAQSSQKMGAAMYANASAAGGSEDGAPTDGASDANNNNDDDVVDAEIVDEDRPQDKKADDK